MSSDWKSTGESGTGTWDSLSFEAFACCSIGLLTGLVGLVLNGVLKGDLNGWERVWEASFSLRRFPGGIGVINYTFLSIFLNVTGPSRR